MSAIQGAGLEGVLIVEVSSFQGLKMYRTRAKCLQRIVRCQWHVSLLEGFFAFVGSGLQRFRCMSAELSCR